MTSTTLPAGSPATELVDYYVQHLRDRVKSLADLAQNLHDAFGMSLVEGVITASWYSEAEKSARLTAIVAAVKIVAADIKASLSYQREPESVVVPGPRLPLHAGAVVAGGALVALTPGSGDLVASRSRELV